MCVRVLSTCLVLAVEKDPLQLLNTRTTITMTITASVRTTATTPPMIATVLSVSEQESLVQVTMVAGPPVEIQVRVSWSESNVALYCDITYNQSVGRRSM